MDSEIGEFAGLERANLVSPAETVAALMVAAVIDSAAVIFICVAARESTSGMDAVGELPGLKSVASTTGSPRSIMRRAAG